MAQSDTYVLVSGAFCGGWTWREIADRLSALGHRVLAPSLTGLADRSHLLSPAINLSTHVTDIANLIKWEELSNIVLVGASYGGAVITGVAEKVPPGAIKSVVYMDAMYLEDGKSCADTFPEAFAALPADDALGVPDLPAGAPNDPAVKRFFRLITPHPTGTFVERLKLTGAIERIPIKTYVFATKNTMAPIFGGIAAKVKANPSWRYVEVPSDHMIPARETIEILLAAAN